MLLLYNTHSGFCFPDQALKNAASHWSGRTDRDEDKGACQRLPSFPWKGLACWHPALQWWGRTPNPSQMAGNPPLMLLRVQQKWHPSPKDTPSST